MKKCNLLKECRVDITQRKEKIINYLNEILIHFQMIDDSIELISDNTKIDRSFVCYAMNIFNAFDKLVMGNERYFFYNMKHKYVFSRLVFEINYKHTTNEEEKEYLCIDFIDEYIKFINKGSSLAVSYPKYFLCGNVCEKYSTLSVDEIERLYREEYKNRYEDRNFN